MFDAMLAQAAERFAAATAALPENVLSQRRPWRGVDVDVRWLLYRTYEELRDLAARIVVERAGSGPPLTTAQRALALYHTAYRDLRGGLLTVEPAEFDRPPAEGEWALRGVLAHVMRADVGFLALSRYTVDRFRAGERPGPVPEAQRTPYEPLAASDGTAAEVLARYDALHERILTELLDVGEAEQAAPVVFWYEADLRFQLFRFDAHLREHMIQVDKVLEAIRPRPGDGPRTARLIYNALGEAEGAALGAPQVCANQRRDVAAAIAARADELRQ